MMRQRHRWCRTARIQSFSSGKLISTSYSKHYSNLFLVSAMASTTQMSNKLLVLDKVEDSMHNGMMEMLSGRMWRMMMMQLRKKSGGLMKR